MEFDPLSEEFFERPFEVYRWLRDEAPAYHNERIGFWALSRYDDCVEAHRDVATYTSTRGLTLAQLTSAEFGQVADQVGSMIMMDPPMHDRMRKLVNRAFTPRRIAEWEPVVAQVVGGLLDDLAGAGSFDAVVDLSGPFPVEVICTIVGVPEGDRQQIRHWTDRMLELEVGNPFPGPEGIEAGIALLAYMEALVADRRTSPLDDMIGHLIEAEVERGDGEVEHLTDIEIARFLSLLTGVYPGILFFAVAAVLALAQRSTLARALRVPNSNLRRRRLQTAAVLGALFVALYVVYLATIGDTWTTRETVLASVGTLSMFGAVGFLIAGLLTPRTPDRGIAPSAG